MSRPAAAIVRVAPRGVMVTTSMSLVDSVAPEQAPATRANRDHAGLQGGDERVAVNIVRRTLSRPDPAPRDPLVGAKPDEDGGDNEQMARPDDEWLDIEFRAGSEEKPNAEIDGDDGGSSDRRFLPAPADGGRQQDEDEEGEIGLA
jgi:hypothetical protein